jgi:16S rRNA (cytidine1402-2'-O)-methyltransferase
MLYIVGTPIGNLEDLSLRQAKILANADYILTEDTRSTGQLLIRIRDLFNFDINPSQRLISYYKEKEFEKLPEVIQIIEDGHEVCQISQAGLPVVSDPGQLLIKTVIQKNIPFTVIPGPTAVTTALLHTGYKAPEWTFIGFLPKKRNDIVKTLQKIVETKKLWKDMAFIAYESPLRVNETLSIMKEIIPDYDLTITRELTKKFEEVIRGKVKELQIDSLKGEITLVLS